MPINFDEIIDRRNTGSFNTDGFRAALLSGCENLPLPCPDEELVRMWVADMEFAVAPAICQAIRDRVDRRIFGYTGMFGTAYADAFQAWCRARYDWDFPAEELCWSSGVVPAITQLVEDLVGPEEKVLTLTPAYSGFRSACRYNGAELLHSPLKCEGGRFAVDFEDLAAKVALPGVRLLILCNPHNPTGRVWTEEELRRIGGIAEENGLWLISDEIHCDLLRTGLRHTPMGRVLPDYPRLITCMSASKTFNIAGLLFSNIIIRDAEERRRFRARDKVGMLNPLSLAAHQAAYESGADWLEELRCYLDGNFRLLADFLARELPETEFHIPEATYLAWVDLRRSLPDVENLTLFFAREAGVLLEGGDANFVGDAEGWVRLNLAMPRATVQKGLERIRDAIYRHRGGN